MSSILKNDDLTEKLDKLSSRRAMLKRLGALGLVAGSMALAPLGATAERRRTDDDEPDRKQDDKPDRKKSDRDAKARPGAVPAEVVPVDERDRRRAKDADPDRAAREHRAPSAESIIAGTPGMSSPRLTVYSKDAFGNRLVTINGSITFSQYDVNQMRLGLKYRVSGKVMEEDDPYAFFPDPDDYCFTFASTWVYPGRPYTPTSSGGGYGTYTLSQRVASSVLNDDDSWTNKQDEVYGLVYLSASTDGGSTWRTLKTLRTNRQDGYY